MGQRPHAATVHPLSAGHSSVGNSRRGPRRLRSETHGLLVDGLPPLMVRGLAYFALMPAPASAIPGRFEAAAAKAVASKLLARRFLHRWDHEVKPAAIHQHVPLQAIDLPRFRMRIWRSTSIAASRSVADGSAASRSSTAPPPCFPFLSGISSPPCRNGLACHPARSWRSCAGSVRLRGLLQRVGTARRRNPRHAEGQRSLPTSDAAPTQILAQLLGRPKKVGAAAQAYLDIVSYRLLDGLDRGDATAKKMPEVLRNRLRFAVRKG